jgi:hypothetical protein
VDRDTALAQYGGDAGLGDAEAGADLFGRLAGVVPLHNVGEIADC